MFASVYPLASRIDLGVCLDCRDHRRSCDLNFADPFDDLFQSRPNVTLAFGEEVKRVCVQVHAGAVRKFVMFGNRGWADPVQEIWLNVHPLWVRTHGAVIFVAPATGGWSFVFFPTARHLDSGPLLVGLAAWSLVRG